MLCRALKPAKPGLISSVKKMQLEISFQQVMVDEIICILNHNINSTTTGSILTNSNDCRLVQSNTHQANRWKSR